MSRKNEVKVSSTLECQEVVFFKIDDVEKMLKSLKADSEKPAELPSIEESKALSKAPAKRFSYQALYLTKEELE